MNPRHLKRLFKNASDEFIKLNSDNIDDTRVSSESKPLDREEVCQALGGKKVGEEYSLKHVEMEFWATHGHKLDQDNARYTIKVVLDALVNLGFAKDDKEITSEVTQRMDKDNTDIH